ncbi:MAG TPA: ABC transporter permease [Caulobacteraceae bacterium]|jgi:peptide/nickel transport system permease protein
MSSQGRTSSALIIGAALSALVVAIALTSLVWTPYDPRDMAAAARLAAPSLAHPFGADAYGRDVLSMVLAGSRTALAVAVTASAIGLGIGAPLGLLAAARGGWVDEAVMRLNDLVFAFPALLIAVLLAAAFGPGAVNAVIAIGIFNVPVFARVARGAALSLWAQDYVLAARLAGKASLRISAEHIAPNLLSGLIVQAAIQLSLAVVADAGLSYVGLGVQPPEPSWGRMLAEAQTLFATAPWLALFPGAAIVLTVLGFSLLGDGLRARLDPRAAER